MGCLCQYCSAHSRARALLQVAGAITPVPGGVGPMTIAMLLKNTLNLARHSVGLPRVPLRKAHSN